MKVYKQGGYVVLPPKRLFIQTGEFRPPKKGEWYLSGAIPEAYMATNDLDTPYHIAKEFQERRIARRRLS